MNKVKKISPSDQSLNVYIRKNRKYTFSKIYAKWRSATSEETEDRKIKAKEKYDMLNKTNLWEMMLT